MMTVEEIERAIKQLPPEERSELLARLGQGRTPAEQGRGLFGSPEDAVLLDEVVREAYEARRRPSRRPIPE